MSLVQKYRPKDLNQIIGQPQVIGSLEEILKKPEKPPNMLFVGPPGTGKTSTALCFGARYLAEYGPAWRHYFHEFNASDARKIEDIRERIKPLAQQVGKKIIFQTEAEGLLELSQQALRRISETSQHAVFIFDLNNESKFIAAMESRCAVFRFRPLSLDDQITKLVEICQTEQVKLTFSSEEKDGFYQIVKMTHGDLRRAINELEKIITANKEINVKNVLDLMKTNIVLESVNTALHGDFPKAKNLIEDAYIMSGHNTDLILDGLIEAVNKIEDEQIKIRLFYELGDLAHRLETTHRAIVPLTSFISYVWIVPHLKR